MTFREQLADAVKSALQEKAAAEARVRKFDADWIAIRDGIVTRTFHDAKAVLQEHLGGGHVERRNGSEIVLEAVFNHDRGRYRHKMTLAPDRERLEVACSSSLSDDSPEMFTLDGLTEEAIQAKVAAFLCDVARGPRTGQKRHAAGVVNL